MYLRLSIQAGHSQRLFKLSVRYPMAHQVTGAIFIELCLCQDAVL